jgi:anti-sigma factor RsiW
MQDSDYQQIKERGWRRPLNPQEAAALHAFLAENPAAREAWKEEAALNNLLSRWNAPTVSSNFTARLLQAIPRQPARPAWRRWFVLSDWIPEGAISRMAMCSLMVGLGLFSFREYQVMHRLREAQELAKVSRLAALPPMDWWKDFETINRMNKVKVADDDLLAALQ